MALDAAEKDAREREKAAQQEASRPKSLTVKDIIAMRQAGISEELIVTRIRKEQHAYDLSLEEMLELKKNGISENLIKVMLDPNAEWKPPAAVEPPAKKPLPKL
jgi:hypothetical protein